MGQKIDNEKLNHFYVCQNCNGLDRHKKLLFSLIDVVKINLVYNYEFTFINVVNEVNE